LVVERSVYCWRWIDKISWRYQNWECWHE